MSRDSSRPSSSRPRGSSLLLVGLCAMGISLFPSTTSGDVIVLKNGNEIRGKVRGWQGDSLEIELPYGSMRIPRRRIHTIVAEGDSEFLERTGQDLVGHRDLDKGLEYLRRAHRANPTPKNRAALVDAIALLAIRSMDEHRYRHAEDVLREARELDAQSPRVAAVDGQLEEARSKLEQLRREVALARKSGELDRGYLAASELHREFPEERTEHRKEYARFALLMGNRALEKGKAGAARNYYLEALEQDPDLIPICRTALAFANVQVVLPLLQKGEHSRVREVLEDALEVLPGHPAILYYLAVTEESAGNTSEAAELYAKLAGPGNSTIHSHEHIAQLRRAAEEELARSRGMKLPDPPARWSASGSGAGVEESRNFIVHYTVRDRARAVIDRLERELKRIKRSWFRGAPPLETRKVHIYLHPDRETYQRACSAPSWSPGLTRHERRLGRVISQEIHFDVSSPQFEAAALPHELAHALLPHLFGQGISIPLWLDEGLATTREPEFKRGYYHRLAREAAADGTMIPLDTLLAARSYPGRAQLFYAEANSLVEFIIHRHGTREGLGVLRTLAIGPFDEALTKSTSFVGREHFERAWLRWLRRRSKR